MAIINVDDAYVLNETGAQVDKVTGLFTKDENTTDAEKAFAQLNIGGGGGGRNLLDNPWFGSGEVVNQRGVTSGSTTNATYFIDRWLTTYGSAAGTYSVGSGGITLTPANGTTATMYQKLANPDAINGKVVTASVLLSDGTIYSGTRTRANGSVQNYYYANGVRIRQLTDNGFHIDVSLKGGVTIRAAKLELGSASTLANDTPPDYGEELAKCQRYFIRLNSVLNFPYGTGIAHNATSLRIFIPTPVTMRSTPTVSFTGSLVARGNGSSLTVTDLPSVYLADNGVAITATTTGATQYQTYSLVPSASGHIDLSADL